jgi:hypothetical protein
VDLGDRAGCLAGPLVQVIISGLFIYGLIILIWALLQGVAWLAGDHAIHWHWLPPPAYRAP